MAVRTLQVVVMLLQIGTKALYQKVFLGASVDGADIKNRYGTTCQRLLFLLTAKVPPLHLSGIGLFTLFMVLFTDWLQFNIRKKSSAGLLYNL